MNAVDIPVSASNIIIIIKHLRRQLGQSPKSTVTPQVGIRRSGYPRYHGAPLCKALSPTCEERWSLYEKLHGRAKSRTGAVIGSRLRQGGRSEDGCLRESGEAEEEEERWSRKKERMWVKVEGGGMEGGWEGVWSGAARKVWDGGEKQGGGSSSLWAP